MEEFEALAGAIKVLCIASGGIESRQEFVGFADKPSKLVARVAFGAEAFLLAAFRIPLVFASENICVDAPIRRHAREEITVGLRLELKEPEYEVSGALGFWHHAAREACHACRRGTGAVHQVAKHKFPDRIEAAIEAAGFWILERKDE